MAPTNTYLQDEAAQTKIAAHDSRLVKFSQTWFPGEEPTTHCDFNRTRELELLDEYLSQFDDTDFRGGNVTVDGACQKLYGSTDEYLLSRVTQTHLHPASTFNKNMMRNGQVVVAAPGGLIVRDDRRRVALDRWQVAVDKRQARVVGTIARGTKTLEAERKRSLRIDPTAETELKEISRASAEAINIQNRLALGQGER
jgi:hypothetical protein